MEALVIAAGKPAKSEKKENCIYAKVESLALDGTNPEAGDEVELSVKGKVASIDDGVAKIELETANGEPLASMKGKEEKEEPGSMEDEYKAMREDAEKEDYGR